MSLYPLGFFTGLAIGMNSISIAIKDVGYSKQNGVDTQTAIETRRIDAAIDASNTRRLEKIFGGSVSDGSIGIFTDETLFFVDTTTDHKNQKQSFVQYGAYRYRVVNVADWEQQLGMKVYLAERHITQDRV